MPPTIKSESKMFIKTEGKLINLNFVAKFFIAKIESDFYEVYAESSLVIPSAALMLARFDSAADAEIYLNKLHKKINLAQKILAEYRTPIEFEKFFNENFNELLA